MTILQKGNLIPKKKELFIILNGKTKDRKFRQIWIIGAIEKSSNTIKLASLKIVKKKSNEKLR